MRSSAIRRSSATRKCAAKWATTTSTTLRKCYEGRVPGGADLVTYWFEKARAQIEAGQRTARRDWSPPTRYAAAPTGTVLDRIVGTTRIFEAWSDEEWINEGAAVRVSLVCIWQWRSARLDDAVTAESW